MNVGEARQEEKKTTTKKNQYGSSWKTTQRKYPTHIPQPHFHMQAALPTSSSHVIIKISTLGSFKSHRRTELYP